MDNIQKNKLNIIKYYLKKSFKKKQGIKVKK